MHFGNPYVLRPQIWVVSYCRSDDGLMKKVLLIYNIRACNSDPTLPSIFLGEMTSSKNKAFLNTGPPSSPGKDVSLLKQMMIHPSEGSFSST